VIEVWIQRRKSPTRRRRSDLSFEFIGRYYRTWAEVLAHPRFDPRRPITVRHFYDRHLRQRVTQALLFSSRERQRVGV
jgi:hypothetical protein